VDVGEIPVERAARPSRVATVFPDAPPSVLVRVGLGSGDDPVGREGLAAALAASLVPDAVSVEVTPGATYYECATDCGSLAGLARGPGPRKPYANTESLLGTAWRSSVFASHPLGRPVARTSVAPTLADSEIASMYRRFFVRENVVAVVAGPDPDGRRSAAVTASLAPLSTALPPDRVRVRPIPAVGPRMVAVEGAPGWRLGQAVPATLTAEESSALWVYGFALGDRSNLPDRDAPWFASDGSGGWRDAWIGALDTPSDAAITTAVARAKASSTLDVRLRHAAEDVAMGWEIRDPLAVAPSRDSVVAARAKFLVPVRWTISVGDAQPESVRKLFLEGAPVWFVQPGIERPTAIRVNAEELYR
jgi:hypothetical protein